MKIIKKTASLLVLALFFACGNNTEPPIVDPGPATPLFDEAKGLVFLGKADGADVNVQLADTYLPKVANGNTYTPVPAPITFQENINLNWFHTVKAEVKIRNFNYYNTLVDIDCKKETPQNFLKLVVKGSTPNSINSEFYTNNVDGKFYTCDQNFACSSQGQEDEITKLEVLGSDNSLAYSNDITSSGLSNFPYFKKVYRFLCDGSDGNEYYVSFYGNYGSVNIHNVFDIKSKKLTGALGIRLADYNDTDTVVFLNQ